jgi:LuxR family maltose regulon positive regulatory protein
VIEGFLQTKLYIPPLRPNLVPRLRLIERLNQGLQLGHKLTLVSAPAGFGKTTLVSEWVGHLQLEAAKESEIVNRIAWLSLDKGDNDPTRFLAYFIAALNRAEGINTTLGKGILGMLQSPQPPLIGNGQVRGRFVPFGIFHYLRGDNNERGRYPI